MISTTLNTILAEILQQENYSLDNNTGLAILDSMQDLTLIVPTEDWLNIAQILKNHPQLLFEQLIDVCGVDYLHYGLSEWETSQATLTGFSRGVEHMHIPHSAAHEELSPSFKPKRLAVVYHLLSLSLNHRLRVKVFINNENAAIASVVQLWPAANWFEREAFDLFGILFDNHPDLRRILTDYGFIGNPFLKDFPLSGEVEVRYDATEDRVLYEPVNIEPRVLVPKVIRKIAPFTKQ